MQGTPKEIFSQVETLKKYQTGCATGNTCWHMNCITVRSGYSGGNTDYGGAGECLMSIELKNVTYTYSPGTAYEIHALKDVNLSIPDGQFIGCDRAYRQRKVHTDPAS